MGHKYAEIMFTDSVKQMQREKRSRSGYERMEQGEDVNFLISQYEADFIGARDSFYIASVSETHWPYVQHRGGPAGFMRVLDAKTIGFADFSGNRQYISTGNVQGNNRVSLFFMDYPNQRRLKLAGRVEIIGADQQTLLDKLKPNNYRARLERGFIIHVEAFDWNCPQHITPRFTRDEMEDIVAHRVKEVIATLPSTESPKALGSGDLPLVITGIRQITPRIRQYELKHADGKLLPKVTPGAHLKVPVRLPDGEEVIRHYSICSDPAQHHCFEIAVQVEEEGNGGSKALQSSYQLGLTLYCDMPKNYFEIVDSQSRPTVLIAGGIGITPIKAMAHAFHKNSAPTCLHFAGASLDTMAYAVELSHLLGDCLYTYVKDKGQQLDISKVMSEAPADTIFYVCGPTRMIDEVVKTAQSLSIPATSVRFEYFSVSSTNNDKSFQLKIDGIDHVIEVDENTTALDAILSAGVDAPFGCRTGQCGQCAVEVLDGEPEHRDQALNDSERTHTFCPCVSRAVSSSLTIKL